MRLQEIVGQDKIINSVLTWLAKWKKGKALLLWGPPGSGKSLIPKTIAFEKKWDIIEINASDDRSAKKLRSHLSGTIKQQSLFKKGKLILIDEIEGFSGKDRGGISEIAKIIQKSEFPVIIVSANPYTAKLFPLRKYCKLIELKKVSPTFIEKHLINYSRKKGINVDPQKIRKAVLAAKGDVRVAEIALETGYYDFRDKKSNVFETLSTFFRAEKIEDAIKAIKNSDKKPDELLRWIEENITNEFKSKEEQRKAFEILSKADTMRKQHKSWLNILATMSQISKRKGYGFYKFPAKFFPKHNKIEIEDLHCSKQKLEKELPYMKFL